MVCSQTSIIPNAISDCLFQRGLSISNYKIPASRLMKKIELRFNHCFFFFFPFIFISWRLITLQLLLFFKFGESGWLYESEL